MTKEEKKQKLLPAGKLDILSDRGCKEIMVSYQISFLILVFLLYNNHWGSDGYVEKYYALCLFLLYKIASILLYEFIKKCNST